MASRYYGINRGQTLNGYGTAVVAEGSSTGTKDLEIAVDLSKSLTKLEVLLLIDELKQYITKGNWPPA